MTILQGGAGVGSLELELTAMVNVEKSRLSK